MHAKKSFSGRHSERVRNNIESPQLIRYGVLWVVLCKSHTNLNQGNPLVEKWYKPSFWWNSHAVQKQCLMAHYRSTIKFTVFGNNPNFNFPRPKLTLKIVLLFPFRNPNKISKITSCQSTILVQHFFDFVNLPRLQCFLGTLETFCATHKF